MNCKRIFARALFYLRSKSDKTIAQGVFRMRNRKISLIMLILVLSVVTYANTSLTAKELAVQATSGNSNEAEIAVKELRELGEKGLESLFENYAVEIETFKKTGIADEKWQRIAHALDTVAMQKDVYASKLFWHKDLQKAQAEAQRTNKPILSLRLLGNLNEEFSCANSRFFRAILYPNAQISNYLQSNYVLHWQSVRPAPKVTIDFGDGRKIERTITGNSIHYVLNEKGEVIDALSGLNSPQIFLEFLQTAQSLAKSGTNPNMFRGNKHRVLLSQMNRIGQQLKLNFDNSRKPIRNFEEMPPAVTSMSIAVTKMVVEMPVLKDITADMTKYGEEQINLENWKQFAKIARKDAKLDEKSIAFIRRQNVKNNLSAQEFSSMISKLEEFISIDTARNEFLLRPTLLVWLAKDEGKDLTKFNEKIYSQLFLTPSADKWLGLYAPDIYTALDGNGVK